MKPERWSHEVEVMRLVGGARWPFVIEGVVVGFAGGLLAILILWLGKITVVDPLSDSIGVTLRRFLKV